MLQGGLDESVYLMEFLGGGVRGPWWGLRGGGLSVGGRVGGSGGGQVCGPPDWGGSVGCVCEVKYIEGHFAGRIF